MSNKIQTFKVDKDTTLLEAIYNFKKDIVRITMSLIKNINYHNYSK